MDGHTVMVFDEYAMCSDCNWFYDPRSMMNGEKNILSQAEKHEEETKEDGRNMDGDSRVSELSD